MTITKLALSLLVGVGVGTGCSTVPPSPQLAATDLPNCFDTNFDKERGLFTMKNEVASAVNQQCLLTVRARDDLASSSPLLAGSYTVYMANGGGGGAGGTVTGGGGGGGGGGGAGAMETKATVNLAPGVYKLTLGAGGPGGTACMPKGGFMGGPGWLGSPSNMIRVPTGELIAGVAGADTYSRVSRYQNERAAGKMDGHGGSGVGQTDGGDAAKAATTKTAAVAAEPGDTKLASGRYGEAGAAGSVGTGNQAPVGAAGRVSASDKAPVGAARRVSASDMASGGGGGGGATAVGSGGGGGGESPGQTEKPPQRGTLGGGGGGGEGTRNECDPGARGGHGYIALRRI